MHGIYVPLVTPFAKDGSVALDALESLAHSVLADGAAGLVALGTTGEPALLSPVEKSKVLAVCAQVCRDLDSTLIVGAGGSGTAQSAQDLEELAGIADAALVSAPAFIRPQRDGVLTHFAQLAERSPVPLIVYHVPYRSACTLDAEMLRNLAQLPGIVGVKFASGALDQDAVGLLADPPTGFAMLAGDDVFLSPMLALGAAGGIPASAHLATERFAQLADVWDKGDIACARPLGHRLAELSQAVFAEPNPAVVKGVLAALGRIPTADVRLPLLPASSMAVTQALARLEKLCDWKRTLPATIKI